MFRFLLLLLSLVLPAMGSAQEDNEAVRPTDYETLVARADSLSLPLLNLTVDSAQLTATRYTAGTLELFDPRARTDGQTHLTQRCALKYRGATSLRHEKKSFTMHLLDADGEGVDVPLFGIRSDDKWILDAMAAAPLRMRNRLCFDLWNNLSRTPYATNHDSRNGTQGVFVEVFLNGAYHGLYCLTDRVNRKLLGLKKTRPAADGTLDLRGLLYKGKSWSAATQLYGYDDTEPADTIEWNGWELKHPDEGSVEAAWEPLKELIDFYQSTDAYFAAHCEEYVYPDNLADYALLILTLNYHDTVLKNAFLSLPDLRAAHRFLVTPWDMDYSLGGTNDGAHLDEFASLPRTMGRFLFARHYALPELGFADRLRRRWDEAARTAFDPAWFQARLDAYAESFVQSGAWQRERDRWNGRPVPLAETPADEADYVKRWYDASFARMPALLGSATGVAAAPSVALPAEGRIHTPDGRLLPPHAPYRGVVIEGGSKRFRR